MRLMPSPRTAPRGFTLLELMTTLALAGILAALAVPAFRTWIANSKVRATSASVMSQVRLAQSEAVKRYRRVVLYRADATTCATVPDASATGNTWVIKTIPLYTGDPVEIVQCSNLADAAADVSIAGPAALCLGTNGWPIAVTAPGIGGTACTVPATGAITFTMSKNGVADRQMQVQVALGGSARMCDAAKTYSSDNPDGC